MHSKETEFEYFIHFFIIESFFLLLLSEKSNSIDEIFFSYIVLIDTLKSTNIQINRKEFGLACIVKKSLYSYWYFFHSVYKDGPTHWFDPASPVVCEETQAIDFRTPRNEPDSNRNLQHVKSISFPSLTPLREIYKISCLFPLHPTTRKIYSIALGSRLVYFTEIYRYSCEYVLHYGITAIMHYM